MSYSDIYGTEYYNRYVQLANKPLAQAIHSNRWMLILKYISSGTILDYGSGPGTFNEHGPNTFTKHNYDVNPLCNARKTPELDWDAVTFWDSLEHIPNFYSVIANMRAKYLFITTPNLESAIDPIPYWKHYRPKEHLYYFDRHSLSVILEELGYKIVEINHDEGKLRDPKNPAAILTLVAVKN